MKPIFLLFLIILLSCAARLKASKPPHIIIILGDDIGWNDFSFHGSSQIPTPNIDALGYNGVVLNRFYTQAICSPSRAALLTAKYPMRYGYQGIPLSCGEDRPLPRNVKLLPERLQQLGYKTHLVGKWHLNAARKADTPTARGFDTHFGYWNGFIGYFNYFAYQSMEKDYNISTPWTGLDLHDGIKSQWQYQGKYATDLFTEKSLEVIDNHDSDKPLFLYVGHLAAHTGVNGTELGVKNLTETDLKYSYIEDAMRRRYADVLNQLDKSVGQVVQRLQQKNMLENSIVIFLSDNGAQTIGMYQNYGSNYPLKGLKFTLLEGGVRGSAVIYSPLLTKKGYINNKLMHITDLHTTLLKLAGGRPKWFQSSDGINQWGSISRNLPSLRTEILLNIDEEEGFSGLISEFGRYKYLNGSYLNGIYDGSYGDSGRSPSTPPYEPNLVLESDVNKAIQSLPSTSPLTREKINTLRNALDINLCNGKNRTEDLPCLGECLFDLWNDPCETENLINQKPLILTKMRLRLNTFIKQLIPSKKVKVDLNSNPINCNTTWIPWLDQGACNETLNHDLLN
ncbi:arylsulfatase B-like [Euwallacea fornicatus]|uniref:arylsulfatase B-like n=1 Tax=Euwallacea fornicatus TaxID=995702 RepID=UPI00338D49DA